MARFPERLRHFDQTYLVRDQQKLLVGFEEDQTRDEVAIFAQGLGMFLVAPDNDETDTSINHTPRRFWLQSFMIVGDDTFDRVQSHRHVEWVAPVYQRPDLLRALGSGAYLALLPKILVIGFRSGASIDQIRAITQRHNLAEIPGKSQRLAPLRYFQLEQTSGVESNVYGLRDRLLEEDRTLVRKVHFESMPMQSPLMLIPNDPLWDWGPEQRWNLERLQAPNGWEISTGSTNVVIAILDTGCDMTHPDLRFDGPGYNVATGANDGTPMTNVVPAHGTHSAGIAAARINNGVGLAGVAGHCRVHAIAIPNFTDVEVASAIDEAANVAGADVISMSFSYGGWDQTLIDPKIDDAYDNHDIVLCASSGNVDALNIGYPASHPKVIAVGAVDPDELRVNTENYNWGSNYGPELDVIAPGMGCTTTDLQGSAGATDTDWYMGYDGTSCACPHVGGLAGLVRSRYPWMSNTLVRRVIESSCEKISPNIYVYGVGQNKPNGAWNQEVGYGRINIFRALDMADIVIQDHPFDDGTIPSQGAFWNNSAVWVRQQDDDGEEHQPAVSGQTNFVYVRVVNFGPAAARNVSVAVRAAPFVGIEFQYPIDWFVEDETHIQPQAIENNFPAIRAGGNVLAKFALSPAQVDALYGWQTGHWHPCLLANTWAANDYGMGSTRTWLNNNLGQRNLSVVEQDAGGHVIWPFVIGHSANRELYLEIAIDRARLPRQVDLFLEPHPQSRYFPRLPVSTPDSEGCEFLDRTRLLTCICGTRGIVTLEAGSKFASADRRSGVQPRFGATWSDSGLMKIEANQAVIGVSKQPGETRVMVLHFLARAGAGNTPIGVDVSQRSTEGRTVGGASIDVHIR